MNREVIVIQNLKCNGCVNSISQMLGAFPEIAEVHISLEDATVTIDTNADGQREKYEKALAHAGYPPEGQVNSLGRKAKSYVSCAIGRINNSE